MHKDRWFLLEANNEQAKKKTKQFHFLDVSQRNTQEQTRPRLTACRLKTTDSAERR